MAKFNFNNIVERLGRKMGSLNVCINELTLYKPYVERPAGLASLRPVHTILPCKTDENQQLLEDNCQFENKLQMFLCGSSFHTVT